MHYSLRFVIESDGFEVETTTLSCVCLLHQHVVYVVLVLITFNLGYELIQHEPYTCLVSVPHRILIVVDMAVDPEHVEVNVDGEDWVLALHVQLRLQSLPLHLVPEKLRLQLYKVKGLAVLPLL